MADASIESQLGVKTDIPKMLTFSTISAKIEDIKVESTADKKVRFTFRVNPDLEQIDAFKIKYGTETKIYTKEVTTFQKAQIKEDTLYTWYVPGIAPGQYFATIIALGKDKKELPVNSGEQEFTISLDAAPTCYVDKISGLSLKKSETYSILSWTKLPDADSYQIFKKDNTGTFAMIDEIKSTSYRVNIDLGTEEEVFEDFKVRATCKNGTFTAE